MNEAGLQAAGANTTLAVTISGGTAQINNVWAEVFDGVDQTTPVSSTGHQTNSSGSTDISSIAFSPSLNINANSQAVDVISCFHQSSATIHTVGTPSGWTLGDFKSNAATNGMDSRVFNRTAKPALILQTILHQHSPVQLVLIMVR